MGGFTASSPPDGEQIGHLPVAGLGVGVTPGVGQVHRGDRMQMGVVDAVAPVVFVGDLVEHVRPHERRVLAFVAGPRRRAQVLRGDVAGHGLLQFQPDHQGGAVVAGPQIGHRGQGGHTAGGAGRLVAGGRGVPQTVVHGGRHRAEMALTGEHLTEGVGHVHHLDVGGVDHRLGEGLVDDLAGQVGEVASSPGACFARSRSGSRRESRRCRPPCHATPVSRVKEAFPHAAGL